MAAEQQKRNIVIIGGGIIGSTTAYFLSHDANFNKERDTITLLEATKIAGGASGKAGGLLALWAYPSCIVPLSYKLHQELAEKHGGAERWGYRAVHCGQVDMYGVLAKSKGKEDSNGNSKEDSVSLQKRTQKANSLLRAAGVPKDLDWVAAEGLKSYEEMGTPLTTAQVHPYQFTTSMATLATEKGVNIIYGTATAIEQENGAVKNVSYTPKDDPNSTQTIHADTIILTAGPWTKSIWTPSPISALRAHSVTIEPSRPVSAYALFTSIDLPSTNKNKRQHHHETGTPEIYARPNNEVYACGDGDQLVPLPCSTAHVQCDDARCQTIIDHVSAISAPLRDGVVTARQACYLPNVEGGGGGPLIGRTSVGGLLMGAGHTCWGIQNGPATGKLLSEIVWLGESRSARIGGLDPRRFGV
ncbi:FAD dependent oxidoreductase [Decorospora gaudefroyi]|uniref:FAD dependent oxidoreductase n=1 Tax=Decorospora gaudefroyi TaxID=184978 RepID=A0A6A5KCE0_9PLEO|nr:FAD dependent oxidoreductase [Decorospora gaudefroyi]